MSRDLDYFGGDSGERCIPRLYETHWRGRDGIPEKNQIGMVYFSFTGTVFGAGRVTTGRKKVKKERRSSWKRSYGAEHKRNLPVNADRQVFLFQYFDFMVIEQLIGIQQCHAFAEGEQQQGVSGVTGV